MEARRVRWRGEWARRVEAEYTSAAIAHTVSLWLLQLGAPPDLIRDGLRVVDDELVHSELSAEVVAATQIDAPVAIDRTGLVLPTTHDPVADLSGAVVRYFCVGETLAVPLFAMLRRSAKVPVAWAALDRIGRDEVRHRQLGWDVLDWLLLTRPELAGSVDAIAWPAALALRDAHLGGSARGNDDPVSQEAAAWGLASPAAYCATIDRALERDLGPRLAARGLAGHP